MQAERLVKMWNNAAVSRMMTMILPWIVPNRVVHGISAMCLIAGLTWALLTPDPFALLRQTPIGWVAKLDDMIQHLVAFCLLSLTVLTLYFRLTRTVSPVVVVLLGSHAVLTECLQAFVPGRTCDPNDALANFAGILLSVNIVLRATSECRKRFDQSQHKRRWKE